MAQEGAQAAGDVRAFPRATEADKPRLKTFISYSRADEALADELVKGLEFADFEVTIDRYSIRGAEDWKARLGALISEAGTVVFILSPDSAKSDICRWEVDHAAQVSKRIIPVLARPLGTEKAPPRLAALNYVRFDEGRSFMEGLMTLVRALNDDLDWLAEHTRLLTRAMEWEIAGRPANRLLSGSDIEAAKAWAARRKSEAPTLTPLHLDFIKASEEAETARQRRETAPRADGRGTGRAREGVEGGGGGTRQGGSRGAQADRGGSRGTERAATGVPQIGRDDRRSAVGRSRLRALAGTCD